MVFGDLPDPVVMGAVPRYVPDHDGNIPGPPGLGKGNPVDKERYLRILNDKRHPRLALPPALKYILVLPLGPDKCCRSNIEEGVAGRGMQVPEFPEKVRERGVEIDEFHVPVQDEDR